MANETSAQTGVGLPVGARIGKYEVKERVAIGGQAIVYKCYDAILDRYVAVKQVSSHLAADPKFLDRFRKEAQILAKLSADQAAIVMIHDLVEDERGLFIVMEYVPGPTLENVLADSPGAVETKAVLQVIWRLAGALHDVHRAGIIHRDIKPGNIIVAEGLRPKIADFGVAAGLTGDASMPLGTTKYMAPELYSGTSVDGRVDMYSLGFIAYELLLGRPKFNEIFADVVRDPHSEAMRWMKWHGNPSVVAPRLHEVNPAIPELLSNIVARMIAKNPQDRFANMEDLGRAIKTAFSPRAKAASTADSRMPRRHRARAAVAASGVLASVAAAGGEVRLDEADDLEVVVPTTPEAPPTAPIPKRKLPLRTKLILAGSAVFLAVVGLLVWYAIRQQDANRRIAEMENLYQDANRAFQEAIAAEDAGPWEKYKEAAEKFEKFREVYPRATGAVKAEVLIPFCWMKYLVLSGTTPDDMKNAEEKKGEAQQKAEDMRRDRPDLSDWCEEQLRTIKEFSETLLNNRAFILALKPAKEAFDQKDYVKAKDTFREQDYRVEPRRLQGVAKSMYHDFIRKVEYARVWGPLENLYQQAAELKKKGNVDEAKTKFEELLTRLDGKDFKGVVDGVEDLDLKATIRGKQNEMKNKVKPEVDELAKNKEYLTALAKYNSAVTPQEKVTTGEALLVAKGVPETKKQEVLKEIATLKLTILQDAALKAEADNAPNALALLLEYQKKDPSNEAINAAIARIKNRNDLMRLVAQGDAQSASQKYEQAYAKYQEAADFAAQHGIAPDEKLLGKITECKFQIRFAEADKLWHEKKDYAAAETAFNEALKIKKDAEAVIKARLAAMQQEQQYTRLLGEGDSALGQRQYDLAKSRYKAAMKVLATTEVKDRLKKVIYEENVAYGEEALGKDDPRSAKGYFVIAQQQFDDARIRELIARAEKRQKEKESGGT
jgi:serine/threonine protein kinase/tetratricopeptide (TPR) repeat protein